MLNRVDVLIEYLENTIGKNNVAVENKRDIVLPLYLNCYEYKVISLYGISYVFVAAKESLNVRCLVNFLEKTTTEINELMPSLIMLFKLSSSIKIHFFILFLIGLSMQSCNL